MSGWSYEGVQGAGRRFHHQGGRLGQHVGFHGVAIEIDCRSTHGYSNARDACSLQILDGRMRGRVFLSRSPLIQVYLLFPTSPSCLMGQLEPPSKL